MNINGGEAKGTGLVGLADGVLSHFDVLVEYKSLLEATGASGIFLGLDLNRNYSTVLSKDLLDFRLRCLKGNIADKEVGVEALLHVLLNRCLSLVSGHVILTLSHVGANQEEGSLINSLLVHGFDGSLCVLCIVEAHEAVVSHGVIGIRRLNKGGTDGTNFFKQVFQFGLVSAAG